MMADMRWSVGFLLFPLCAFGASYDRSEYGRWIDADRDCQNTRAEVLERDSNGPTTGGCRIRTGDWTGPYTGQRFTQASDLDIDHIVPIKHAHEHGAGAWPKKRKRAFYNDMENLLAVDDSTNQSKGSKGIDEWMPPLDRCDYASRFVWLKAKWELRIDQSEVDCRRAGVCWRG